MFYEFAFTFKFFVTCSITPFLLHSFVFFSPVFTPYESPRLSDVLAIYWSDTSPGSPTSWVVVSKISSSRACLPTLRSLQMAIRRRPRQHHTDAKDGTWSRSASVYAHHDNSSSVQFRCFASPSWELGVYVLAICQSRPKSASYRISRCLLSFLASWGIWQDPSPSTLDLAIPLPVDSACVNLSPILASLFRGAVLTPAALTRPECASLNARMKASGA